MSPIFFLNPFFSTLFTLTFYIGNQSHHSLNYPSYVFSPMNEEIQVYFLIFSSFLHKRNHSTSIDRYSFVLCIFHLTYFEIQSTSIYRVRSPPFFPPSVFSFLLQLHSTLLWDVNHSLMLFPIFCIDSAAVTNLVHIYLFICWKCMFG